MNLATGQAGFPESRFASLMNSKMVKLHVNSQKGGKACCSKVGNHLAQCCGRATVKKCAHNGLMILSALIALFSVTP